MPLEDAIRAVEKKYGAGIVLPFSEVDYPPIQTIPTGSLRLDWAIGGYRDFKGIPLGRISILWGAKGVGKTTLEQHIIANAQKIFPDRRPALIDHELSYDPIYASACGVDPDLLLYVRPYSLKTGEQYCLEDTFDIVETLARSGDVSVIFIDSIDALRPKVEVEGEYGESHMGKKAFLMGQAVRRLVGPLYTNSTALVAINQLRYKLGLLMGNPETMSGGEALKHHASLRIDMRLGPQEKVKGEVVGRITKCRVPWNKIAPPSGTATFTIVSGQGIDRFTELVELGAEQGVLEKRGTYYSYNGESLAQGMANAAQFLREHPEAETEIENKIRAAMLGKREVVNNGSSDTNDSESDSLDQSA